MTGQDPGNTEEQDKTSTDYPTLTIDWETYGQMLADSDLSEDEQIELIQTLWSIVVAFVDLGFGIHPAQQCCGEEGMITTDVDDDVVHSSDQPQSQTPELVAALPFEEVAKTRRPS